MAYHVNIVGGGLAGSEAALALARMGCAVTLFEMRPHVSTGVHRGSGLAELVCSNSLKGMRSDSAAGMLKRELDVLGSPLYRIACETRIPAGGALAVDREAFSGQVSARVDADPHITVERAEISSIAEAGAGADVLILATGPLTSDALASDLEARLGCEQLAFFDAAAPIVMADSLDQGIVFRQSRYEDEGGGDYLNAPMGKEEYGAFISELLSAERVIAKEFETKELFQACQPIEEVARAGFDAPRFGALKPVGLTDPRTGKRPHAVVQLRQEDASATSFNLVGFQTNLTFPEQKRVFRMIPGLANAEFARYGVMHRNTFLNAPALIDAHGRLRPSSTQPMEMPIYVAGQLAGTEGYCEAIRSGLNCAISAMADLRGVEVRPAPPDTAFGALMAHASDAGVKGYQPMHVNFGIMPPHPRPIKNKRERYAAHAERAEESLARYLDALQDAGVWSAS